VRLGYLPGLADGVVVVAHVDRISVKGFSKTQHMQPPVIYTAHVALLSSKFQKARISYVLAGLGWVRDLTAFDARVAVQQIVTASGGSPRSSLWFRTEQIFDMYHVYPLVSASCPRTVSMIDPLMSAQCRAVTSVHDG
jgi:hypothetical protein